MRALSIPGEPFRILCFCQSLAILQPVRVEGGALQSSFLRPQGGGQAGSAGVSQPPQGPTSRAPPGCRVQVVIVTPWLLRGRISWLAPIEDRVEKDMDPTCAPPCLQAARVAC